ncbi:unnamed protein product, partial [Medioppia subpectinata]
MSLHIIIDNIIRDKMDSILKDILATNITNMSDYAIDGNDMVGGGGDGNSCANTYDIMGNFDFKEFNFPNREYLNPRPFTWCEYTKIALYVVAIAAVMVGNIGVILAVALNTSLRITQQVKINYYLANLAVADVLICVCCMWTHLVNHLTEPLYVLGP